DYDGARVWDVATARALHTFPGKYFGGIAFTPDGHGLLMTREHQHIQLWDLRTNGELRRFAPEGAQRLNRFRLPTDGTTLLALQPRQGVATGRPPGLKERSTLLAWDLATGHPHPPRPGPHSDIPGEIAPDGRTVIGSGGQVFESSTGQLLYTLPSEYS